LVPTAANLIIFVFRTNLSDIISGTFMFSGCPWSPAILKRFSADQKFD
jgi:hypothetical protein